MDRVQRAVETFHKPYSCAQAVYAAFKDAGQEKLEHLKANSGGRAEGGICGALFAARLIVKESDRSRLEADFAETAGDTRCKELKTVCKTPCPLCVKIAAELAEKYSG